MRTPSARGIAATFMLAAVLVFAAACGSRTGDYGGSVASGGDTGCLDIGQACDNSGECCDATCEAGFCGGTCTPDGNPCDDDPDCCSGDCDGGVCGGTTCAQQGSFCELTGDCCGDLLCIDNACTVGGCLDDGQLCTQASECCSSICEGSICGGCVADGGLCFDGTECCSGSCDQLSGTCFSPGCTHDECQEGAALSRLCSDCTTTVCNFDPFCCDTDWDTACVSLAETQCGLPCSACTTNGNFCASNDECCSGFCPGGICQNPCSPDGAACNFPSDCCSGLCNGGFCGPGGDCSHDECTLGGPLDPSCTPCVATVCAQDPFCCDQSWDGLCIDEAEQFCGLDCGNCTPDGQFCTTPMECCSGSCNGNICGSPCIPDGGFCNTPGECCSGLCNGNVCGLNCVPDGGFCSLPSDCCNGQCNGNICGPGGDCSHDECTVGGPLLTTCTACTATVCALDPFCCDTGWDSLCVSEAETECGLSCTCTADGQFCNNDPECCSGSCNNNVCGPPCSPDGSFCFDPDECCSGTCNAFQCGGCLPDGLPCSDPTDCCAGTCNGGFCGGGPVCPSDGSPCGDCIADNCCGELVTCLTSPDCFDDVLCFQSCVSDGTPLPLCFFQCINDPAAFDVLGCMLGNCGSGQCF